MSRFKDQALCIRLADWSESSQIVTLLTQMHGKIRGLAKGSRRLSPGSIAKFSGGFELLTAGQIVATTKPSSDLATLTEWDLQQPHDHLRRDLKSQYLGLYAADLANALLAEHDVHPRSHDALLTVFGALGDQEKQQASLLQYQWDLLSDAGYQLELFKDFKTTDHLPEASNYLFDPHQGGFTGQGGHERSDHPHGPWKVRATTLTILRSVAASELAPDTDPQALLRANKLLCVHVRAILDRELPTMKFVMDS